MISILTPPEFELLGHESPATDRILTGEARGFLTHLARAFGPGIGRLLRRRRDRQARFDGGDLPSFLSETAAVRDGHWRVAPLPEDLRDRRVEITGPVDRKMIINAMNSGARVFMADFEDSTSPVWENLVDGQVNLMDAVRGTISYTHPTTGKGYALADDPAVLFVRPRGLHMVERHVRVDGVPIPASLFDFGLFFFHNARALVEAGSGPYFYLPKLESHLEARLWNDIFLSAQVALGLPEGTIKATVLIETLPAAFEMDEILYELRAHSAGLNCGRWDYIFSTIKTLSSHARHVLPDRGQVGMTQPNMQSYTDLVVRTCHRRGVHAMGGMAAQIPIKGDEVAHENALAKVRKDKEREVASGHDGTWVAHPGLVPLAQEIFDAHMPGPNQLHVSRDDVTVGASDLLAVPQGTRTEEGLRQNLVVGVRYLEAWLRGVGCVPLFHLMEDAATAEISRTQVWQWVHHGARLDDGRQVTVGMIAALMEEEMAVTRAELGPAGWQASRFPEAHDLFLALSTAPTLAPFLTLQAYELLRA